MIASQQDCILYKLSVQTVHVVEFYISKKPGLMSFWFFYSYNIQHHIFFVKNLIDCQNHFKAEWDKEWEFGPNEGISTVRFLSSLFNHRYYRNAKTCNKYYIK
jgi:hypothetical protein